MALQTLTCFFHQFLLFLQTQTTTTRWCEIQPLQAPQRPVEQRIGQADQPSTLLRRRPCAAGQTFSASTQCWIPEGQELLQWWDHNLFFILVIAFAVSIIYDTVSLSFFSLCQVHVYILGLCYLWYYCKQGREDRKLCGEKGTWSGDVASGTETTCKYHKWIKISVPTVKLPHNSCE